LKRMGFDRKKDRPKKLTKEKSPFRVQITVTN